MRQGDREFARRIRRLGRSLGGKLFVLLLAVLLLSLGILGFLNIRLHRSILEETTLLSAERVSDVIKRSTAYYMMRNDREALYHTINTIGHEPGMERVRIFNQEGRISFSTEPSEINTLVDKRAEACYACHAQSEPLTHLDRPDRSRIYQTDSRRVLGVITPINNSPECSNAACHAHPAGQKVLGVLDTTLSLDRIDASLNTSSIWMLVYAAFSAVAVSCLFGLLVWRLVHRPVRALKEATARLRDGELGYETPVSTNDELGDLAESFNAMSVDLLEAHKESNAWAQSLEARVEQKTAELRAAHDQMLQAEKLASLGKMAAVVAHEINNPLSGIVTYARLMRKWIERGDQLEPHADDMRESLALIESESRRCGEIVKNLLNFARATPINLQQCDVNAIVQQCMRLVEHKLDLANVSLHLELDPQLPLVDCDGPQIEQLLLALTINAIDAMPREGNLTVSTRFRPETRKLVMTVEDDGIGIPDEVLPRLFEPFVTTKEEGHGVGLGLAICRRIVERHNGRIDVESEPGRGTRFIVTLPAGSAQRPDALREESLAGTSTGGLIP